MGVYRSASPLKCWKGYERVPGTAKGAKGSCREASPNKKKKTSKSIEWHDSDAPDAKGKFKDLSPSALASWLIKTRKTLAKSIASLNQQIVFNRKKNPKYAAKMRTTQNIVRKLFGKDKA